MKQKYRTLSCFPDFGSWLRLVMARTIRLDIKQDALIFDMCKECSSTMDTGKTLTNQTFENVSNWTNNML